MSYSETFVLSQYLRIYFLNNLWGAEILDAAFVDAFEEFARISKRTETHDTTHRIFNLIPVVGSGRDASFENLISLEVLASKLWSPRGH